MSKDEQSNLRRLRRKQSLSDFDTQSSPLDSNLNPGATSVPNISNAPQLYRANTKGTSISYQSAIEGPNRGDLDKNKNEVEESPMRAPQIAPKSSYNMSNQLAETVRQLERLLNEAVEVARTAAGMEDQAVGVRSSSETLGREVQGSSNSTPYISTDFRTSRGNRDATDEKEGKYNQIKVNRPVEHIEIDEVSKEPEAQVSLETTLSKPRKPTMLANEESPKLPVPVVQLIVEPTAALRPPNHVLHASPSSNIFRRPRAASSNSIQSGFESDPLETPVTVIPRKHSRGRFSVDRKKAVRSDDVPLLQLNGRRIEEDSTPEQISKPEEDFSSPGITHRGHFTQMFGVGSRHESIRLAHPEYSRNLDLRHHKQIDIPLDADDAELHSTCNHMPVARNWSTKRKRISALVACINTCCIGLLLGIYAGEVPAIQYVIVDLNHSIILGNVVLYLGLMVSTLLLWPLPLLHGRKPYTVGGLMLALCLQVPQGIAVIMTRLPNQASFRVLLLLSRALCGLALGLCDINLTATLLDLFGASLQSQYPHQEVADLYDVRRHGGGMGLWLGVWSWCSIGPLSIGFMTGAFIISRTTVDWGFWTSQLILMVVILINVMSPEIRRSAYRRTLLELVSPVGEFGRVARGEVKMHLKSKGPS